MNRNQLIAAISKDTNVTVADARAFLDAFIANVQRGTAEDGVVSLPGFGTWKAADTPERTRTNPQTGQPMTIPASRRAKFSVGSHFKETVKAQRTAPASA